LEDIVSLKFNITEKTELDKLLAGIFTEVALVLAPMLAPLALLFKKQ
jgi:hypothetical protein